MNYTSKLEQEFVSIISLMSSTVLSNLLLSLVGGVNELGSPILLVDKHLHFAPTFWF